MRDPRQLRPLDQLSSIKTKLGVLVAASVSVAALVVWQGLHNAIGPRWTLPAAVALALVVTQVLAHGMTSPLREMTAAARAMATGDYSRRVRATSRDEVGQLAAAFNRMADDLATADRQRRELVANVSHELRTPVTALHAQLENLVDGVTEPDPQTLEAALAQTERLSQLLAQLLDLSRLEAGVVPLESDTVPFGPFLSEVATSAELVASAADRDVRWDVDVEPPDLTVTADPGRLRQVVTNLLDNAARHSPPGGLVTVRARAVRGRGASPGVRLDVVDEGPGIEPADREAVFERFHRGSSSQSPTGGTGLGLAIARWAVELHGGTIEVGDSRTGCRISVFLPAPKVHDPRTPPAA
jgi:signal transduction histidine kinase